MVFVILKEKPKKYYQSGKSTTYFLRCRTCGWKRCGSFGRAGLFWDRNYFFTTSHDKYAINAIKNNAADYLLKPIKEKELKKAIEKVAKRLHEKETLKQASKLQGYLDKIKNDQQQDLKLMVPTKDGMIFLKVNETARTTIWKQLHLILFNRQQKYW